MKKITFSKDQTEELIKMYTDTTDEKYTFPVSEILDTYQISLGVLNRILREQQVPFRRKKATGKRTNVHHKKCEICKRFVTVKDALFCPYCGADVRSKSEKILSKLGDLWDIIYPNFESYDQKEECRKIMDEIANYIKSN